VGAVAEEDDGGEGVSEEEFKHAGEDEEHAAEEVVCASENIYYQYFSIRE
jgi:hypothetical protein